MNRLKILVTFGILLSISFLVNCDGITPKKKEDNTNRNILILGILNNSNTSSSSSCTSGMVICIPKGLAE